MEIITLIPAVIFLLALFRYSVQDAFKQVYLPVFVCLPAYYYWKVAALPPIHIAESVLLPLGLVILLKERGRWRFSWMDAVLLLFIYTSFHGDQILRRETAWRFEMFNNLCIDLVPYMIGKLLIEANGQRIAILRRMMILMFATCIVSAYEYKMGQNPFSKMLARFYPLQNFGWHTQIRWGFGRVAGPYAQSELAGQMFFFGLIIALYLLYTGAWEPKFLSAPWLPGRKATVIAGVLGFTLIMSQARGPWIGALVGVPLALVGRTRRVLRWSIIYLAMLLIVAPIAYIGLQAYAQGPRDSEEQENASYRAELIPNYLPVATAGGAWGWGPTFPREHGQGSIDNAYLFLALTQGWVGLACFCLLGAGAMTNFAMAGIYSPSKEDRFFAFSLMGTLLGILVTVFTVFLDYQPYQLFFLLAGWSQALRPEPEALPAPAFEHVYT